MAAALGAYQVELEPDVAAKRFHPRDGASGRAVPGRGIGDDEIPFGRHRNTSTKRVDSIR
ncbi:MAG: hypothetical protein A2Z30_00245 [Chloroflexi bacterium RBG_16_64_43]|nr:MAG: hypothetical protein A2Z30_00245 [Chloroflexi bacterium RBG_16_64_43]